MTAPPRPVAEILPCSTFSRPVAGVASSFFMPPTPLVAVCFGTLSVEERVLGLGPTNEPPHLAVSFNLLGFGELVSPAFVADLDESGFDFRVNGLAEQFSAFLFSPLSAGSSFLFFFFSSALACLSFLVHAFFNSDSSCWMCAGTARFPVFTASSNLVFATALFLEGGRP